MHDERSHPLLQQTPLSVNPFIDLPKPPTLPHNYATLPSTLPPSSMDAAPVSASANPDLPAYVTSSSGFAAHPSTIIGQNKALLEQFSQQKKDAEAQIAQWEQSIQSRELQEKRRKAPGWLDGDSKLLEPERVGAKELDSPLETPATASPSQQQDGQGRNDMEDLGAAMDRAFGRSEMASG